MARPVKYDTDELLDAAARIAAAGGPRALTMTALAREAGVPNGSVYHRFPGRPALLAEVWLRSVEAFQSSYLAALRHDDPVEGAVAAARHTVAWSRANPHHSKVLSYGPADFGLADWPEHARKKLASRNRAAIRAVRAAARRAGATTTADYERFTIAVLDVPYGIVRRHLRGRGIPAYAPSTAEQTARAILTART
jgi:AcrR family transcriptional regulator